MEKREIRKRIKNCLLRGCNFAELRIIIMSERLRSSEEPDKRELDPMRAEHLVEGINPIVACIGTEAEYKKDKFIKEIRRNGENINFYASPQLVEKQGLKNAGRETYVISPINPDSKYTEKLFNCTSVMAVGRARDKNTELSMMSHQNPRQFLYDERTRAEFTADLEDSLNELKHKCIEGTVDVVIAGGHWDIGDDSVDYRNSLEALSSSTEKIFGFMPVVVSGPKYSLKDDIYFDTQKRRLYVVRPDDRETVTHKDAFVADGIDDKAGIWDQERREFIKKERPWREVK